VIFMEITYYTNCKVIFNKPNYTNNIGISIANFIGDFVFERKKQNLYIGTMSYHLFM